jgi:hypothetical protein
VSSVREPDPHVELVDVATHEFAVRRRVARRGMVDRSVELADWVGVLGDLAERHVPVSVQLGGGRTHRGRLTAVALDHLVLAADGGTTVFVAMPAVRAIRSGRAPQRRAPSGDRPAADERTLLEALVDLLPHDPHVLLGVRDLPGTIRGRLVGVGEDVLTLRTEDGGTVLFPDAAIADVAWGLP